MIDLSTCSVSGVVPLSHDIRDAVAERWLCVEYTIPSLSCIDTDTSQYELMAQTCHLWNVRKIPVTFHRCAIDSLLVGNGV